ncbi:MAG: DEAD/DEAH box helicase [Spirochaetales bacterium]|nr:DEAD/DEAH box helicase [Spirochaetales bacterium]
MFNKTHALWSNRILQLLHKAGYLQPTQLQETVIPLMLKGRDIAIEAGEKTGKTAAFILPILEKINRNKAGIKALVLTASFDNAKKISREFNKFIKHIPFRLCIALLGNIKGERDEFRILSKRPDVVIGPSDRVIDHIRRGNLSFEQLQFYVIEGTDMDKDEGFGPDIHFISTKLYKKHQTVFFSPKPFTSNDALLALLKRPLTLTTEDWRDESVYPRYNYYELQPGQLAEKKELLVNLIVVKQISSLLLICYDAGMIADLAKSLKHSGLLVKTFTHKTPELTKQNILKTFNTHRINILITTINFLQHQKYIWPSHIIHFDPPAKMKQYAGFIPAHSNSIREVILFMNENLLQELQTYEETKTLTMKKEEFPTDEDVIKGLAKTIVKRIKEDEDPETLNMYSKILKKNIPFFLRSYALAFLFKESLSKRTHKQKSSTTSLFISVGKNRRVFPPDLVTLLTESLKIKRVEIKDIKILDNYSFVEISTRYASKAISLLNGKEFKGKKLSVNYARKKEKRTQISERH